MGQISHLTATTAETMITEIHTAIVQHLMEDHLPTQAAENIFQTETIANEEGIKVQ
jgi:hypothetical protein